MTRLSPTRGAALRSLFPEPVAAKVPEITALFWVIKVLTTGMGEAASDYLAAHNLVVAAALGLVGFALGMAWQLRVRRYRAGVYLVRGRDGRAVRDDGG